MEKPTTRSILSKLRLIHLQRAHILVITMVLLFFQSDFPVQSWAFECEQYTSWFRSHVVLIMHVNSERVGLPVLQKECAVTPPSIKSPSYYTLLLLSNPPAAVITGRDSPTAIGYAFLALIELTPHWIITLCVHARSRVKQSVMSVCLSVVCLSSEKYWYLTIYRVNDS